MQVVLAIIFHKCVILARNGDNGPSDTVGIPAHDSSQIRSVDLIARYIFIAPDHITERAVLIRHVKLRQYRAQIQDSRLHAFSIFQYVFLYLLSVLRGAEFFYPNAHTLPLFIL